MESLLPSWSCFAAESVSTAECRGSALSRSGAWCSVILARSEHLVRLAVTSWSLPGQVPVQIGADSGQIRKTGNHTNSHRNLPEGERVLPPDASHIRKRDCVDRRPAMPFRHSRTVLRSPLVLTAGCVLLLAGIVSLASAEAPDDPPERPTRDD